MVEKAGHACTASTSRWVTLTISHLWPSYRFLGVPPGRGSCPLTGSLPFDLIYTDYHGLQQMKQHMGLSLRKYKWVLFFQSRRAPAPPWLFFCPHRTVVLWIPFESPVAFRMKYSTIGLLAGFSHKPVNLLCISKILPMVGVWGEVQSGVFSTVINQVFSHTCQPRVIDLAHAHLCTIIKSVYQRL